MNNTVVRHINSVDSKLFHMGIVSCSNFTAENLRISAPADSPNTDGIHIERSSGVTISSSFIGTGDDCISIGQGNSVVVINGVTCGPGHGIRLHYNTFHSCACLYLEQKDSTKFGVFAVWGAWGNTRTKGT